MKNLLTLLLVTLISTSSNLYASHIPGGNITYQCTGNPNEYVITLELYVNCPNSLGNQYMITTYNDCGLTNPFITLIQTGIEQEISSACPSQTSLCNGGTLPGIKMFTYEATITLPDTCDSWKFVYDICCRNTSSNLSGASSNNIYFETIMNSQTAPCDDSPYITNQPYPFVCAGIPQSYCPGIVDPNGDSIYVQSINPMGTNGTPIAHTAGYSAAVPLNNFTLDSQTGCITFNQATLGNYVVSYLIEAYDNAGNMTGSIVHDFQFQVLNCSNTPPISGGIVLTSGNATLLGPGLLEICEGASTCFDVTFTDIDALDTLAIDTALSSLFTLLPGASITTTGINPYTVSICWTVPAGSNSSLSTTLTVNDGACPVIANAAQLINFNIINNTTVNPDITICGSQTAQLSAAGGSVFTWTSIAGDPINVGSNFSCNPCSNPIASPSVTTTYLVTSDLIAGCGSTDTVIVNVALDFTITAYGDTLLCASSVVPIGVNMSPLGSYTINWTPAASLNDPTISTPLATPSETTTYNVTVTSTLGCSKTDTVNVSVNPTPIPTISPGDSTFCAGTPIQFDVLTSTLVDNFTGSFDPSQWSTVSGASVGNPCVPFNGTALNFDTPNRELISNSLLTSNCTTFDFCLWIGNDISTGVTGCENADLNEDIELSYSTNGGATWITIQTFLTSNWDTGGPYANVWQCFSIPIPAGALTNNTQFKWAQIGFYGTTIDNWSIDNINLSCSNNNYIYSWSPGNTLSDSTITNPIATPTVTTNYTLTVTDTATGCSTSNSQTITTVANYILQLTPDDTICVGNTVNFNVATSVPGTYSYLWSPGGLLSDSTIFNPIGTFNTPGTNQFIITVSNGSCIVNDTVNITVNICTYINELGDLYDISIFPNPNTGSFNITKPANLDQSINIQLYTVEGKLILEETLNKSQSTTNIDISKQSKGLYFIHLRIGDEKFVRKIMKN
ncbi:MAG: hypothetical protein COB15_00680 [Flavobacteriales bacterium]|nr:MAG: hypothetical protein COB15_00680 [Flavobacteriales bacterium]